MPQREKNRSVKPKKTQSVAEKFSLPTLKWMQPKQSIFLKLFGYQISQIKKKIKSFWWPYNGRTHYYFFPPSLDGEQASNLPVGFVLPIFLSLFLLNRLNLWLFSSQYSLQLSQHIYNCSKLKVICQSDLGKKWVGENFKPR